MSLLIPSNSKYSSTFYINIAITLIIILSGACLFFISNHSLISHDEAIYASRARLILLRNNWFTPFQSAHHKTIGSYWLIALSIKFFGINEIAARLPSFISSVIALIYTFKISNLFINKRSSLIAVIILLSSPIWFQYSHYCSPDMIFVLLNLIAIYQISKHHQTITISTKERTYWNWFVAGTMFSLAFTVRSYMELLPLISFTPYIYLTSRKSQFKNLKYLILGILIGLIPTFVAFYFAYNAYGFNAISQLASFTSQKAFNNGILNGVVFYPRSIILLTLPCGFICINGIRNVILTKSNEIKSLLIGSPIISILLLMLGSSNHYHYCLIITPWIAILSAIAIDKYINKNKHSSLNTGKTISISFLLIGFLSLLLYIIIEVNLISIPYSKEFLEKILFIFSLSYLITGSYVFFNANNPGIFIKSLIIILTIHSSLIAVLFSKGLIGNPNYDFKKFIQNTNVKEIINNESVLIIDPISSSKERFLFSYYFPKYKFYEKSIETIANTQFLVVRNNILEQVGMSRKNKINIISEYKDFKLIYFEKN